MAFEPAYTVTPPGGRVGLIYPTAFCVAPYPQPGSAIIVRDLPIGTIRPVVGVVDERREPLPGSVG